MNTPLKIVHAQIAALKEAQLCSTGKWKEEENVETRGSQSIIHAWLINSKLDSYQWHGGSREIVPEVASRSGQFILHS